MFPFAHKDKPVKLPVGITEFEQWSDSIIQLAGPIAEQESMKFVLAMEIMHWASKDDSAPLSYFVSRLRTAAAKQVAAHVFSEIKAKQESKAQTETPDAPPAEGAQSVESQKN